MLESIGEAGLLDGAACTTFPQDYQRLGEAFPGADVRINVSFVHHGRLLTSQGGVRSYDVALYLVELLYSREAAQRIGRGLLVEWPPREGSDLSFISDPTVRVQPRPAPPSKEAT